MRAQLAARAQTSRPRPLSYRHASRSLALRVSCSVLARWTFDARYGHKAEATSLLQDWVKDVGSKAGLSTSNTRLSSGAIGAPEARLEMEVELVSTAEWEQFIASIPSREHKAWSQRAQGIIIDGSPRWEVFHRVPVDVPLSATPTATRVAKPLSAPAAKPLKAPALREPGVKAPAPASESPAPAFEISNGLERLMEGAVGPANDLLKLMKGDSGPANELLKLMAVPPRGTFDPYAISPASGSKAEKADEADPLEVMTDNTIIEAESAFSGLTIIEGDAAAEVVLDWKGDSMKINPKDKLPFKFL
eukprot:gene30575-35593_t